MKNIQIRQSKSRLAKGIDYLAIRLTIFALAVIVINQLGVHFYASIILGIFITAIINRQVNYFKQKRLTQMAKLKSQGEADNINKKETSTKAFRAFNFIMSALFLFCLGLFLDGWFKYYFYGFSLLNLALAGFSLLRLRKTYPQVKEEGNN